MSGPADLAGAGGEGFGLGGGGTGTGSGAGARRAVRIAGMLNGHTDYPRAARRLGMEGTVAVRFTVGTNGRARGCAVIRSTAGPELDAITCRLIEQRFRYEPALGADGEPVDELVWRRFEWSLPGRG